MEKELNTQETSMSQDEFISLLINSIQQKDKEIAELKESQVTVTRITTKRPEEFKVNVLGTIYTVTFKTDEEDVKLLECDGYCDNTVNTIIINWLKWDGMNHNNMLAYIAKVIRHEVIHAFLYQSGLDCCTKNEWARNEEMIDWMAIQINKLAQVCFDAEKVFVSANKDNIVKEIN
jgi:hypothetical protein